MKLLDSSKFTKDQLDAIVTAFDDLSDGLQAHHYAEQTGNNDPEAEENFSMARAAVTEAFYRSLR